MKLIITVIFITTSLLSYSQNVTIKVAGSGSPNSNIGTGFRLAVPNTNNVKTLFAGTNVTIDSTTNANGITINAAGGGSGGTAISLTTNNTIGASTLIGGVLNIPNYAGGIDTSFLRRDININTTAITTKLNIADTAGIRLRATAGTNMTITGTYPSLTFNALQPTNIRYQVTAVPFANASGILTSDSTKLSYESEYLRIGTVSASGVSGIFLNQGRAEIAARFGGITFNIGSGYAGVTDNSKSFLFSNRGKTYLQIGTAGTVSTATFSTDVVVNGVIRLPPSATYAALVNNATSPAPPTGEGTMVYSNGHFFGWIGTAWKQLDN